jgi:hydrogenase maturation protease
MAPATDEASRRVVVFACGNPDRGDDALAAVAVRAATESEGWPREQVSLHVVDSLAVEDLVAVPPDAVVLIVDAVAGPEPGSIIETDLAELGQLDHQPSPASSHTLPLPRVIGLAGVLRGSPLEGRFLGIAVADVTEGAGLSTAVLRSLPRLANAIASAVGGAVAQRTPGRHR